MDVSPIPQHGKPCEAVSHVENLTSQSEANKRSGSPPVTQALQPKNAKIVVVAAISLSFIGAAAAAAGHHFFLSSLHGRHIDEYSQFWVKTASNAFAHLVVLLLGIVATTSLTQMVCIDHLSSLSALTRNL
jgi:hypothetical protein